MKKRSIALMLTLALLGTSMFSGCGGNSEKGNEKKVENEKAGEISFAWWGNEDRQKYLLSGNRCLVMMVC